MKHNCFVNVLLLQQRKLKAEFFTNMQSALKIGDLAGCLPSVLVLAKFLNDPRTY
jgi:hypothetical protein